MAEENIIIIGAGAAGLMAAKQLAKNYHVIILEAAERVGGRTHTLYDVAFGHPVETGPEFVHGNLPVTKGLLKEANIPFTQTTGEMYRFNNGAWVEEDEEVDGWDELMECMKGLKEDMALLDFLNEYYPEDKFSILRDQVKRYAEGFDVADPARVSTQALYKEWSHETGAQYRIDGGYSQLINWLVEECLSNGCELHTNSLVKQIDWVAGDVTVYTEGRRQYTASKAIITVPIIMLQKAMAKGSINFTPALDEYVKATNDIGYGDAVKVILQFKQPFWEQYKNNMAFIVSSEWMPVWWTQLPDKTPTLTGWLGGPKATALSDETDEFILQNSKRSLCNIFSLTDSELDGQLTAAKVFNWARNPLIGGAYSYLTPSTPAALTILTTPVENTLFFAGEALYNGDSPGTVEAAFTSGRDVAEKLLKDK